MSTVWTRRTELKKATLTYRSYISHDAAALTSCLCPSDLRPAETAVGLCPVLVPVCSWSLLLSGGGLWFQLGGKVLHGQPLHPLHRCGQQETQRRYVYHLSQYSSTCLSLICSPVSLFVSLPDISGLALSLVVHTSVPFGLEHLEWDKEDVQPIILQELHRLLPHLPQPVSIKCQKWRYSQVSHMFLNS